MSGTRTAQIFKHPSGCVIVRALGIQQTLEDAQENVERALELSGGPRKGPLLVDITGTAPLTSEVRHYYVGGALANNFTALALVVEASPMGRMMGDVFFRMIESANAGRSEVGPTKLFEDEAGAIEWLASVTR